MDATLASTQRVPVHHLGVRGAGRAQPRVLGDEASASRVTSSKSARSDPAR